MHITIHTLFLAKYSYRFYVPVPKTSRFVAAEAPGLRSEGHRSPPGSAPGGTPQANGGDRRGKGRLLLA